MTLVLVYAIKMYTGSGVELHSFLILALDGRHLSASQPPALFQGKTSILRS
jgi:hypothetical protein